MPGCDQYINAAGTFNSAKALANGLNSAQRASCGLAASKKRGSLRPSSMPSWGGRRTRKQRKGRKGTRKAGKSRRNRH